MPRKSIAVFMKPPDKNDSLMHDRASILFPQMNNNRTSDKSSMRGSVLIASTTVFNSAMERRKLAAKRARFEHIDCQAVSTDFVEKKISKAGKRIEKSSYHMT